MSVQKNTITIDDDGMPNTISIKKVTHTPSKTKQLQGATTSVQPEPYSTEDSTPSVARDNGTEKDKYVVRRIVGHIEKGAT